MYGLPRYSAPMPFAEFTALLVLATAVSFTPGPNTTLSTALAANHGLRHAMRFVCAVPVGWSALLLLCALGAGAVIAAVPALRWAVLLLGVGYMLWLAARLAGSGTLAKADARMDISFAQGVLLQFVNIKAWMLALSIVAGWVAGRTDWPARLALVLPVMVVYAFASNLLYASIGSLLRRWLAQGRRLLWFNRVMAAALALTAAWMAWTAVAQERAAPQAVRHAVQSCSVLDRLVGAGLPATSGWWSTAPCIAGKPAPTNVGQPGFLANQSRLIANHQYFKPDTGQLS